MSEHPLDRLDVGAGRSLPTLSRRATASAAAVSDGYSAKCSSTCRTHRSRTFGSFNPPSVGVRIASGFDDAVVVRTHEYEVVQCGHTGVPPGSDVVGVAGIGWCVAVGSATGAVPELPTPAGLLGHEPSGPSQIEHFGGAPEDWGQDVGITQPPPEYGRCYGPVLRDDRAQGRRPHQRRSSPTCMSKTATGTSRGTHSRDPGLGGPASSAGPPSPAATTPRPRD